MSPQPNSTRCSATANSSRFFSQGVHRILKLTRRQRIRSLIKLGHLADAHTLDELQDRNTTAHQELVRLIGLITRPNSSSAPHTGITTTGAITLGAGIPRLATSRAKRIRILHVRYWH